eukprot:356968-Chlamydomonas_euryale.AAC.13
MKNSLFLKSFSLLQPSPLGDPVVGNAQKHRHLQQFRYKDAARRESRAYSRSLSRKVANKDRGAECPHVWHTQKDISEGVVAWRALGPRPCHTRGKLKELLRQPGAPSLLAAV